MRFISLKSKLISVIIVSILIIIVFPQGIRANYNEQNRMALTSLMERILEKPSNTIYYEQVGILFELNNINGIKVFALGALIDFKDYNDVQPTIINGRTLIPVRALAESLGAVVEWDEATRLVTINFFDDVIKIYIDSKIAYVNGREKILDVPAMIIDGRTMVPLRFISESLNKQVGWHPHSDGISVISIYHK